MSDARCGRHSGLQRGRIDRQPSSTGIRAAVDQVSWWTMVRPTRRRSGRARRARRCCSTRPMPERATPSAPGLRTCCRQATSRTCSCSTATCSICRRRPRAAGHGRRHGRRRGARRTPVLPRRTCRRRAITPTGWAAACCRGSSACRSRHPVRIPGLPGGRAAGAAAARVGLRDRNRDAGEGPAARRPPGQRAGHRGLRGRAQQAAPVRDTTRTCFLAVYYRFLETYLMTCRRRQ